LVETRFMNDGNHQEAVMAATATPSQRITAEVTSWPGIEAGPGRRGEFAFTVGRRSIGHLHGDRAAHFSFPKRVWLQLREQGRIVDHPVFPGKQGPAARRIDSDADVEDVIALLRLNYDRMTGVGSG
jgi:hypothetical protein